MSKKILNILAWIFGVGLTIGGFQYVLSDPVRGLYYFGFAAILLPPVNKLIAKTPHPKLIKLAIIAVIVVALILQVMQSL